MSRITADHAHSGSHAGGHDHATAPLRPEAVTLPPGAANKTFAGLMFAGVVAIIATIMGAVSTGDHGVQHAMAAYHIGFLVSLGMALGSLGLVMIFQQFNAGWCAAVRRQAENIATLFPLCLAFFLPVVILEVFVYKGKLFHWMDASAAHDVILQHKSGYLSIVFWLVRAFVYFFIWIMLSTRLARFSREQDQTGDKWLTAKARRVSSYGLLLFALTLAFASFDWLMSLDPHWYSTMFGVQFFAGSTMSAVAMVIIILGVMRMLGRLEGLVTAEHFHDLGKILLAFTVFWAYVTFCQYFLIWYSNIPEETAWYNLRKEAGWLPIFRLLIAGHFLVPFVLLLFRGTKRNYKLLMLVAIWMIVMHMVDVFFIARPTVHGVAPSHNTWLDVLGILGPVCIFLAFVARRVAAAPLIPLKDPRLAEALAHKNYV